MGKLALKTKFVLIFSKILRAFILTGLCFVILLPIFKMFSDSINGGKPYDIYFFIPTKITFRGYISIFRRYFNNFLLGNTLIFSITCAVIQTLICAISGFAFSQLKFIGYKIIMVLYFLPLVLIRESMYIQYKALYNYMPLFGINFFHNKYSVYILYLFGAGIKTPIFIYLFKICFDRIDYELIEQSRVDGCGVVRTFFRVCFPLAKDAIVPTLFLTFIWEYNDYYYPQYFGFSYDNFNVISFEFATGRMPSTLNNNAIAMLFPVLIIYVILEKTLFNAIAKDVTY